MGFYFGIEAYIGEVWFRFFRDRARVLGAGEGKSIGRYIARRADIFNKSIERRYGLRI